MIGQFHNSAQIDNTVSVVAAAVPATIDVLFHIHGHERQYINSLRQEPDALLGISLYSHAIRAYPLTTCYIGTSSWLYEWGSLHDVQ